MKAFHICDVTDVAGAAPLCKTKGFGIEVQAFYDPATVGDDDAIARHQEAIQGISRISMHGPFGDLCPGSFEPTVRQVTRDRFEFAYKIAAHLGATDIVLHHGYVPGTSSPEGWIERFVEFWRDFSAGKGNHVRFHLENALEHGPEVVLGVLAAISQDNVDACLDVGHVHCYSQTTVDGWIEALGERIGYVHLHDNNGEADEHLGFGEGTAPIDVACRALEVHAPNAIWALECAAKAREGSLSWLLEHKFLQ